MFDQVLKEPILFNWVTEQIKKDREERAAYIQQIFEAVQPWLDFDMYKEIEKRKERDKEKLLSIAKVDSVDKVQTENAFDIFMKNLGINKEDING